MPVVVLRVPIDFDGDPPEVDSWVECARKQLRDPPDLDQMEEGDSFALFDRNDMTEEWSTTSRRVIVLIMSENALIFDEHGELIDDPSNFLPGGIQPLREGDNPFLSELGKGDGQGDSYYRFPTAALLGDTTPVETTSDNDDDDDDDKSKKTEEDLLQMVKPGARIMMCFGGPGVCEPDTSLSQPPPCTIYLHTHILLCCALAQGVTHQNRPRGSAPWWLRSSPKRASGYSVSTMVTSRDTRPLFS
jgi:hypothetical protein